MTCLWCDEEIITELNWENLLLIHKRKYLCDTCEEKLELIKGRRCNKCSRSSEADICLDCKRWAFGKNETEKSVDPLVFNFSVFTYNEKTQEIIAKWKYRGDYQLVMSFKYSFERHFREKFSFLPKDTVIVPIPLSKEREMERGFNQAKALADFLPFHRKEVITRIHGEKQSKKSRYERISTKNPFTMRGSLNKTVVLVDDIYTTGTTLRHAAVLLRENGCPNVYSYTLIRG